MRNQIADLNQQLEKARVKLKVIQEVIDEYVLAEEVPLQLRANETNLKAKIAQLEQEISTEPVAVPLHMSNNAAELKAAIIRLQAEVNQLQQENEELRAAAGQAAAEMDAFDHALVDVLRHASALARILAHNYGRVSDRAQALTSAIERALTSTCDPASIRALTQAYDIANIIADTRVRARARIVGIAIAILFLITLLVAFFVNIISNSYVRLAFIFVVPMIIFPILNHIVSHPRSRADNLFKIILGIADTRLGATHPEVITFEQVVEVWKQRERQERQ